MATAKKSTRKTTKNSKKSQSKLAQLFSLRTGRSRFIVIILLIAVAGAGWFTYKSAAKYYGPNYPVHLSAVAGKSAYYGSARAITEAREISGKQGSKVVELKNGGALGQRWRSGRDGVPSTFLDSSRYRFCVTARSERGASSAIKIKVTGASSSTVYDDTWYSVNNAKNGGGYSNVCSKVFLGTGSERTIRVTSASGSIIRVGAILLQGCRTATCR